MNLVFRRLLLWPAFATLTIFLASCDVPESLSPNSDITPDGSQSPFDENGNERAPADSNATNSPNDETPQVSRIRPQELFRSAFAAYRSAESYRDAAELVIRDVQTPDAVAIRAPLAVQWQRPNQITFSAYDLRVESSTRDLYTNISNPDAGPLTQQVTKKRLPTNLTLDWLLSDPLTRQYASSGPAGIPPQLPLLLATSEWEQLVDQAEIRIVGLEEFDGVNCQVVSATSGRSTYVFWIDPTENLFRKVQFPSETLPVELLQNNSQDRFEFGIEFLDASFSSVARNEPTLTDRRFATLRHWVLAPAPLPTTMLGQSLLDLQLPGPAEVGNYRLADRVEPISIFFWLDNGAASRATIQLAMKWVERAPEAIRSQVELVAVGTSIDQRNDLAVEMGSLGWPGKIAFDDGRLGSSIGVTEAPSMMILDERATLQFFEERHNTRLIQLLDDILPRILDGFDLAAEIRSVYDDDMARYHSHLYTAAASTQRFEELPAITAFPTASVKLERTKTTSLTTPLVSAEFERADRLPRLWGITETGTVVEINSTAEPEILVDLGQNMSANAAWRVLPANTSEPQLLVSSDTTSQAWIVTNEDARPIALANGESILSAYWVPGGDTEGAPVLIGASSAGRQFAIETSDYAETNLSNRSIVGIAPIMSNEPSVVGYQQFDANGQVYVIDAFTPDADRLAESRSYMWQLDFKPKAARYFAAADAERAYVAVQGERGEDGASFLIVLNDRNETLWELPIADRDSRIADSGFDEVSSQLVWAVLSPSQVLHLIRADGAWRDSISWAEPILAANINQDSGQLYLTVVFRDRIEDFAMTLP